MAFALLFVNFVSSATRKKRGGAPARSKALRQPAGVVMEAL
ncbi:hypothetical protein [Parvibaculum sp.]